MTPPPCKHQTVRVVYVRGPKKETGQAFQRVGTICLGCNRVTLDAPTTK